MAIANQLGVSTTPVREALLLLAERGYVKLDHNRGAEVAPFSVQELRDISPIIGALAALAAQQAIPLPAQDVEKLRRMNHRLRQLAEAGNRESFHRLHLDFHDVYVKRISNRILADLFHDLRARVYERYGFLAIEDRGRMKEIVHEHAAIISAFRTENRKTIDGCIRSHLEHSGLILETLISERGSAEVKKSRSTE